MLGLVNQIVEARATMQTAGIGSTDAAWYWGGNESSKAGVPVNRKTALGVTAYYCAIKVISEAVGQLPINLIQRDGNNKNKINSPLWATVARQPNDEQTSVEFWEHMAAMACQRGVAYAEIAVDDRTGNVKLWPLPMDTVSRVTRGGKPFYEFRDPTSQVVYVWEPWRVFKLSAFALNGLEGLDIISAFQTSIGLAIATQEYGANFFGKGATPGVVLETPHPLKAEAKANIETTWQEKYGSMDGKSRVAVLQHGLTLKQFSLTNEQSQFLQSRNFNVLEFARMYRIPPHMLMDASQAKWANIEAYSTEFVVYTLGPWIRRIEQRLDMQLLTASEAETMHFKFNVNALLRGDTASRKDFYATMLDKGVMSIDQVRELEDWNPQPDGIGDVYYRPMNTNFVGPGAAEVSQPVTDAA